LKPKTKLPLCTGGKKKEKECISIYENLRQQAVEDGEPET
jgi:hypothetical protein